MGFFRIFVNIIFLEPEKKILVRNLMDKKKLVSMFFKKKVFKLILIKIILHHVYQLLNIRVRMRNFQFTHLYLVY